MEDGMGEKRNTQHLRRQRLTKQMRCFKELQEDFWGLSCSLCSYKDKGFAQQTQSLSSTPNFFAYLFIYDVHTDQKNMGKSYWEKKDTNACITGRMQRTGGEKDITGFLSQTRIVISHFNHDDFTETLTDFLSINCTGWHFAGCKMFRFQ